MSRSSWVWSLRGRVVCVLLVIGSIRRRRPALPDAPGGVIVTRAPIPQQGIRVIAGVVVVAPERCDGVLTDELDVDEACLFGRKFRPRIEPARHAGFAPAEG